jgi:K+/H+ antiporter YhaU regulatory subunit KhtT
LENDVLHERLIKLEREVQANKRVQDEQSKAIAQIAANLVMITEEFTTIVSNLKIILRSTTIEDDQSLIVPEDKKYVN